MSHGFATERWGTDFDDARSLQDAGWKNFLGAREGAPRVGFQGRTVAGEPPQNAVELSLEVSGSVDWFGGLFLPLTSITTNDIPDTLRIRARVAQRGGSTLMIRVESSPENWIGLLVDTPDNAEWVDVDAPLSNGIRRGGALDPLSERLRLVVAFVDDGRDREAEGGPSMFLGHVWLEISNDD